MGEAREFGLFRIAARRCRSSRFRRGGCRRPVCHRARIRWRPHSITSPGGQLELEQLVILFLATCLGRLLLPLAVDGQITAVTSNRAIGSHLRMCVMKATFFRMDSGVRMTKTVALAPPRPVLGGEGLGVRGRGTASKACTWSSVPPPHPNPFSPEYGGEGLSVRLPTKYLFDPGFAVSELDRHDQFAFAAGRTNKRIAVQLHFPAVDRTSRLRQLRSCSRRPHGTRGSR